MTGSSVVGHNYLMFVVLIRPGCVQTYMMYMLKRRTTLLTDYVRCMVMRAAEIMPNVRRIIGIFDGSAGRT